MVDLKDLYTMMKEFHYEKNGLDMTIDFLKIMLDEFIKIKEGEKDNE